VPPVPAGRVVGWLVTLASALVLLTLVGLPVFLATSESRLSLMEEPERALALIVGRTMDARAALDDAPAWERRLYTLTLTDTSDEIEQAIGWYEELARESLAPDVDLRLAILLGEAGRREPLQRSIAPWPSRGEPLATYGEVIAAAYLQEGGLERAALGDTLVALGEGWFADALLLRVAANQGEPGLGAAARESLGSRSRSLLWRLRALAALDLLLLSVGGVAAAAAWRRRRQSGRSVSDAPLPPPWTLGAGLIALVRGGALAVLVWFVLLAGDHWLLDQPVLSEALAQPLMYLPLLLLVWHGLLARTGVGFAAAFGLRPRAGGQWAWLRASAALVAAGITIDLLLGVVGEQLGLASHWTEWFDADLAWGPTALVVATLLGSILFAPVFEELIFRGVLYGTLRARLSWPLAALGSALIFALAHGYGIAGFLSVFLSGVLWAWVYERTGSLLPSITAHVANNAAVALTLTALLR
jgi:uncharacterized protein